MPAMETSRLILRGPLESDMPSLYAIYSSPSVVRFTGDGVWDDIEQAEEFLSGVRVGVE